MPVKTEIDTNAWEDFHIHAQDLDETLSWKDLSVSCFDFAPVEFFACVQDYDPSDVDFLSTSPKQQIRNHDCMWSGTCVDKSHPGKLKLLESTTAVSSKQSLLSSTDADNKIKENECNTTNSSNQNNSKSITNNIQLNTQKVKLQQIQPGRSLLINSRLNQNNNNNNISNKNFNVKPTTTLPQQQSSMSDLFKFENNSLLTSATGSTTRPDTPLSLDDDPPEFKHNFDLAACTSGSNNMSLVSPEDAKYINMLKEHLEESTQEIICSKQQNDLKQLSLQQQQQLTLQNANVYSESLTDLLSYLKYMPEFPRVDEVDEEDSAVEMDSSDSEGGSSSSNGARSINSGMSCSSSGLLSSQSSTYEYHHQATHVSDHSYTRPKKCYDTTGLGVETPSDSEEEIDVVSIGDKNLPTNPSARDRRALQTTVAHKISSAARMMKQQSRNGGIKTLPPRRRISHDSGLLSPASTPKKSASISTINSPTNGACTPLLNVSNNRKRPTSHKDHHDRISMTHKRHKGKKQRPMSNKQRVVSDTEDMSLIDTLEKRNLHNDMERQRRIGLKNLFEELKRQIPTIRDKDRAPKVNILREAAILCTKLNREQEQYNALKKQQTRLLTRVKNLRAQLATHRRFVDVVE